MWLRRPHCWCRLSSSTTSGTVGLKDAMKRLYKRIHPDVFYQDEPKRQVNATAFPVIQSFLSQVGAFPNPNAASAQAQGAFSRPSYLEFYVRDEGGNIREAPVKIKLVPGPRGVAALFQALDLPVPQLPETLRMRDRPMDAAVDEGEIGQFMSTEYSTAAREAYLELEKEFQRLRSSVAVRWKASRLGIRTQELDLAIRNLQQYGKYMSIDWPMCQVLVLGKKMEADLDSYGRVILPFLQHPEEEWTDELMHTLSSNRDEILPRVQDSVCRAERIRRLEQRVAVDLRVGLFCAESMDVHATDAYVAYLERIVDMAENRNFLFSAIRPGTYQRVSIMVTNRELPDGVLEAPAPGVLVTNIQEPISTLFQHLWRCGNEVLAAERQSRCRLDRMVKQAQDSKRFIHVREITFDATLSEEQLIIGLTQLRKVTNWPTECAIHVCDQRDSSGHAVYVDSYGRLCVYWHQV